MKTDFNFSAMFPSSWVVGFGVPVLVSGGATVVSAVPVPGGGCGVGDGPF